MKFTKLIERFGYKNLNGFCGEEIEIRYRLCVLFTKP